MLSQSDWQRASQSKQMLIKLQTEQLLITYTSNKNYMYINTLFDTLLMRVRHFNKTSASCLVLIFSEEKFPIGENPNLNSDFHSPLIFF